MLSESKSYQSSDHHPSKLEFPINHQRQNYQQVRPIFDRRKYLFPNELVQLEKSLSTSVFDRLSDDCRQQCWQQKERKDGIKTLIPTIFKIEPRKNSGIRPKRTFR